MQINQERLWKHIYELAEIGKNKDGSITRLPFTLEDKTAQEVIFKWMQEAGLKVEIDAVGNVIGTYEGSDKTLTPILCGSHYDSVKCGGMFDGCLGVIAAIEIAQTMYENKAKVNRSLKIVGFKDEEGNRFTQGMVGSKSIAGCFKKEHFASLDGNNISLSTAMEQNGHDPEEYQSCIIKPHSIYELHIEQAKTLEENKATIGIVEGIAGITRYTITIYGNSAHAGATPMQHRKDPVVAMSDWIMTMTQWANQYQDIMLTVGVIDTYPSSCNVICDHTTFQVDIRAIHEKRLLEVREQMNKVHTLLNKRYAVNIESVKEQDIAPCICDKTTQKELEDICKQKHITYQYMMSGAGHDCMNFKDVCPITLIFVPSHNGESHCKEEFTSKKDCAIGCDVLYTLLMQKLYD